MLTRDGAIVLGLLAAVWTGGEADAQTAAGALLLDTRLRFETVSQEGLEQADALTLRARLGYETPSVRGFKGLVELEAVADLAGDYNDTVNGRLGFAAIPDPHTVELNRLQLAWAGDGGRRATLGRQRIVLGNARFVGNVGFRQNEQTFDALRLEGRFGERVSANYLYIDRVRRIFGDDSAQGEWESDSHVLAVDSDTPVGRLGGYALLLDFNNAPAQSSQTYGVRWSHEWRVGEFAPRLALEAARQSEYRGNTAPFDLDYHLVEAGARRGPLSATVGWERLEGNGARGFSTPLATLHAFQGWADVFLTTPPDGVRDLYAGLSYTTAPWPNAQPATFSLRAHQFGDDNGGTDFGDEIDASARFALTEQVGIEFKAASFNGEDARFADRTKFWVSIEFRY